MGKRLGGSTAGTADSGWPKVYSLPCHNMPSNKNGKVAFQGSCNSDCLVTSLLVVTDCLCNFFFFFFLALPVLTPFARGGREVSEWQCQGQPTAVP